jgi:hydrogenase maturation protein HypF
VAGFADGEPLHAAESRFILAVGGELKSTVCLLRGGEAVLSEHLGDLMHPEAYRHFVRAVDRLKQLCAFVPEVVACDLHPRYLSTTYARQLELPVVQVQHHHAHIASVMAEWGECGPVVGLACDGTGYGTDGTVWGGEILLCERGAFQRVGHLERFPLVGGDRAAIETWRPAAALLRAAGECDWQRAVTARDDGPSNAELRLFEQQVDGGPNVTATSSLGRVFDAVAFLLGLCGRNRHEAEAAMALEGAATRAKTTFNPLGYGIHADSSAIRLSLLPAVRAIATGHEPAETLAARFHDTVIAAFTDAAARICQERKVGTVALSGGCLANRRLLGGLTERLEGHGLRVLYPRRVPAGDGGLALGQSWIAAWHTDEE